MNYLNSLNFLYFKLFINWMKTTMYFIFFKKYGEADFTTSLNIKNNSKSLKLNCLYYKLFKIKYNLMSSSFLYYIIDLIFIYWLSYMFKMSNNFFFFSLFDFKIKQSKFYHCNEENNIFQHKMFLYFSMFSGLKYFWKLMRFWVFGMILGLFFFYYLTYFRLLSFNKVMFEWFLMTMFIYWLLSGFVYFIKKYQYSKYTSVMQRFWKSSFILFWAIEGYLFFFFFFVTLNASEEPVYMYDQMKLYKTHLFSWSLFFCKMVPIVTMMILTYYLQLTMKWSLFNKQNMFMLSMTVLMLYVLWLEFYQFFHIMSFYGSLNWMFDYDEFLWNLELEFSRTSLSNNYMALCLVAKFWHLMFIFIFWIFFLLSINEMTRVSYPLLAANYQNLILLYFLSWLYMYPWFKYFFSWLLDSPYYWLMINNSALAVSIFFVDLKLFLNSFLFDFWMFLKTSYYYFSQMSFYYWYESSNILGYNQFKKHMLSDFLMESFNF